MIVVAKGIPRDVGMQSDPSIAPEAPTCPVGSSFVQSVRALESNGCSKPGIFQIAGEEDFTYCCDRHDACYETCGMDRQFCEAEFSKCLNNMCATTFSDNPECNKAAGMYTMGTMFFGDAAFQKSQEGWCECIAQDEIDGHHLKLIDSFYQTYVSTKKTWSSNKVIKNTGTRSKPDYANFKKMWYRLHDKYDHAIVHVEDRVGKNPPRLNESVVREKQIPIDDLNEKEP